MKGFKEDIIVAGKNDYKEVDFEDLKLELNAPMLSKENVPVASSNFEELAEKIKLVVAKYKDTELTPDNVNYVKTLKSHFVSLRTSIEKQRKEWKTIYVNPMTSTIDGVCADLTALAQEGEKALKKQLDDYDQKRKDQLTIVLTEYKNEAVIKYNLRSEFADKIVLLDKYYNITQKEDDSIDDIDFQASELAKKQIEYDSSVAIIKEECEGTTLVEDSYIRLLDTRSPMEILMLIKKDKKKAKELYEDMRAKEEAGEKIVIGKEPTLEQALSTANKLNDKEAELKVKTIRIHYRKDQAMLLADFFATNEIEVEYLK